MRQLDQCATTPDQPTYADQNLTAGQLPTADQKLTADQPPTGDPPPTADPSPVEAASEAVVDSENLAGPAGGKLLDQQPPTNELVASEQMSEPAPSSEQAASSEQALCGGTLQITLEMPIGGVLLQEKDVVHSPLLPYLGSLAWMLEGRTVARQELVDALLKRMRQRSIRKLSRREYVRSFSNQHPP